MSSQPAFRLFGFPVHVRAGFYMFMVFVVLLNGQPLGLWLAGFIAGLTLLHELGHAFGLPHRQDTTNLMASGTTGIWLNADEIRQVREQALKLPWIEPAATVNRKVAELNRAGKTNEASIWYRRLAAIPLTAH